jgi:hypothetical protein
MKIAVFIHTATMNHWEKTLDKINKKVISSGLYNNIDCFFGCFCKDHDKFEFPTLDALHAFAKQNPDYYILYLHTKGVTHPIDKQCIQDWLDCMLYFNVELWRENIKALDCGYDASGINVITDPFVHYQGNFWWAKASYIANLIDIRSLKEPKGRLWSERHKAEMWILSNPCARINELYNHKIDPYSQTNPRENYVRNTNS